VRAYLHWKSIDNIEGASFISQVAGVEDTRKKAPSKLDKKTQALLKLIFDHDMFRDAMAKLNIGETVTPYSIIGLVIQCIDPGCSKTN